VKLFHAHGWRETFRRADEAILSPRRRSPETDRGYRGLATQQRGLVMWNIILSLIYRRLCRNCLAAARSQRGLNQLRA
jgi:hypothetical protein